MTVRDGDRVSYDVYPAHEGTVTWDISATSSTSSSEDGFVCTTHHVDILNVVHHAIVIRLELSMQKGDDKSQLVATARGC